MVNATSSSPDYVKGARSWYQENIGDEEKAADFKKAVVAGAGIGAGTGAVFGMAKSACDAANAKFERVETRVPIYEDKLEGYDQHAEPIQVDGRERWSLKFTPTVRREKVGEYTRVEYRPSAVMSPFVAGLVGMTMGAIGGGLAAAAIKVIRDIIFSKE